MASLAYSTLFEQKLGYAAGVMIYCPKTGRFLFQKRGPRVEDPGEYDYFGGGVDEGEDILDGAVRELAEEGGINIKPESLYPLVRYQYLPSQGMGGYHIFLLVVTDEFECIPSFDGDAHDEVDRCDWIGPDELNGITLHARVLDVVSHPQFTEVLRKGVQDRLDTDHVAQHSQGLTEGQHHLL
jgi:8-oxo-dGTP pyrophosphatase MutT (NUDIX family)